jgi:hypothetical protein
VHTRRPSATPPVPSRRSDSASPWWQQRCLAEALALLRRDGHDAFVEAAVGDPAAVIAETAHALERDLVAIGYVRRATGHDF